MSLATSHRKLPHVNAARHSALGPLLLSIGMLWVLGASVPPAWAQATGPAIVSRSPLPGDIGLAIDTQVTVSFNETIQSSAASFVLMDSANSPVPANVTYNTSTNMLVLSPTVDLVPSRTYTATVSGVIDLSGNSMGGPAVWSFSTGQPGFRESTVFSGLDHPTAFQFAADGRIFVAEKSGIILVYQSLSDGNPTVFADLRTNVHNFGNRGLLGMALDPNFPSVPYVYVLYAHDAPIGGVAPTWGSAGTSDDSCSQPDGACVISGRLSRLQAAGNVMTGAEQVLVEDWYQQYSTQSVGNLAFGPDGALYASAGDGASSALVDSGQTDSASPDPLNQGGALRSQDLRTPADPVTLDGSVIRVHPDTGLPFRKNTSMIVGTPTVDANGVKSYPVTSVYQGSQQQIIRVLEPTNPSPGTPQRFLYVLPVQDGLTDLSSAYGDGLEELRLLDVPNRFNMTLIAPSFNYEPWYGDNSIDPNLRMESFVIQDLVPFGDTFAQGTGIPQRFLIGFSKSGNGVLFLLLRHPNVFSAAAAWDSPAQLSDLSAYAALPMNFGTQANFDLYNIPALVASNAQPFQTQNRLWISGDQAAFTADMDQLDLQLSAASIPHTWVQGGVRAHNWGSGWLDGAVTDLAINSTTVAPTDSNQQRIIAYGLRNPHLAFRPGTQEMWIADQGWDTWEEIDRIPDSANGAVENFGWPCYEGDATTAYSTLGICTSLYSQPGATSIPFYAYDHQSKVVPGDEGGVGNGAISGLAFYASGNYPPQYQGALFFADDVRNQIWVMFKGSDGNPDPTNIASFLLGAKSPVDLKTGPNGDLFYADLNGGSIRRVSYSPPVVRSNGQPAGILPAGTTQTTISLTTDQNASCRYATTAGVPYFAMPGIFSVTGGTSHSTLVTGLAGGVNYSFFVRCADAQGNANSDDFPISFSVASAGDTTPPVRSNRQPTGVLPAGTTQASLSLTTDEDATCRYATAAGVAYASMPNIFASTGAIAHSTTVTGLADGGSYSFYVRCQDASGNANPDDFVVSFSVSSDTSGGVYLTSLFSGIEDPLSENGMWDTPGSWTALKKSDGVYSTDMTSAARLATPTVAADQFAEITYDQDPGTASWVGVMTRVQGPGNGSGYLAIAYAGQVRLYRTDDIGGLSFTLLASANEFIGTAPRDLRLESQGFVHRVFFNGVLAISFTDTTYTAGQPGIADSVFGGPTVKILSFTGGTLPPDTTPPVRSNGQPTGVLPAGSTQASLAVTTSENATCRYATAAGVDYASMPNTFSSTGGTAQATIVTGLANGGSYSVYVRCQDGLGNANTDDFVVSFSVGSDTSGGAPVTSFFSGIEDPLSENGMWDTPGSWTALKKSDGAYSIDMTSAARLATPAVAADQFAEITYDQDPGTSSWVGVMTRVQGPGNGSGYLAIAYAGQVRLYRADDIGGLSFTLLASANELIGTAPRDLRLESAGSTHRIFFNGLLALTFTDASYTVGQPGIADSVFGGPTVKILSFTGGTLPPDTAPPVRSNGQPTGVLPAGSTQASLTLTTSENATCRYATAAGVDYASMPNTFTGTGGTAQSTTVTGLANGGSYSFYVRCQDGLGNANADDFVISFSVSSDLSSATASSLFAGIEDPLSENGMWDTPGSWTALKKNDGAYSTDITSAARLATPAVAADQFAEITYDQDPGTASWVGVMTRVQGPGNGSGYLAIAYAGQVRLYRADDVGGLSFTLLASADQIIGTAPRDLRLESQGSMHSIYFNGLLALTFTDATYTTGQPGIADSVFGGPTVKILSFTGGTLP